MFVFSQTFWSPQQLHHHQAWRRNNNEILIFFKPVPAITKFQLCEQSAESSWRANAVCHLTISSLKIEWLFLSSLFCQTLTTFVNISMLRITVLLTLFLNYYYYFKANLSCGTSSFHCCIRRIPGPDSKFYFCCQELLLPVLVTASICCYLAHSLDTAPKFGLRDKEKREMEHERNFSHGKRKIQWQKSSPGWWEWSLELWLQHREQVVIVKENWFSHHWLWKAPARLFYAAILF